MTSAAVSPIRPVTLGGSTIAAAAGLDPYKSRAALFLELTGAIPTPEGNEHTAIGTALEPVVVSLLPERGYEVAAYPEHDYRDARRPWLIGHPDALLASGELLVGEVKVTGGWARRSWDGDTPPTTWRAQVQTYMYLGKRDRALIAALIDGTRLELVEVWRDERAIALLLAKADEFYDYVCRDECPPFDGSPSEREALHALYPEATSGRVVRASKDVRAVVEEMRLLREAADATERQYEERRRQIEATMGDAETLVDDHDATLAKWTTTHSRRVESKRLKDEYPVVYEAVAKTTVTRRFTLA